MLKSETYVAEQCISLKNISNFYFQQNLPTVVKKNLRNSSIFIKKYCKIQFLNQSGGGGGGKSRNSSVNHGKRSWKFFSHLWKKKHEKIVEQSRKNIHNFHQSVAVKSRKICQLVEGKYSEIRYSIAGKKKSEISLSVAEKSRIFCDFCQPIAIISRKICQSLDGKYHEIHQSVTGKKKKNFKSISGSLEKIAKFVNQS